MCVLLCTKVWEENIRLQIALQLVKKNGMSYFAPNMIVLHRVEEMLAERVLHRWMA